MNLTDSADPQVAAALTHHCGLCHAIPGLACRSIIDRMALPGGAVVRGAAGRHRWITVAGLHRKFTRADATATVNRSTL